MATTWRITLGFPEPSPLHHPHRGYCLRLLRLCWLISLAFLLVEVEVEARVSIKGCLDRERDALLLFKASIEDPSARLSAWRAQVDCCAWTGVVCHNRTGSVRVAELNLQNPNGDPHNWTDRAMRGELAFPNPNPIDMSLRGELLHPSLLSLTHLQSLNLSFNDFEGTQIPPSIASLHELRYLDLSWSNFGGTIPPHLGNLTNLRYLDLIDSFVNSAKVVHSLDWLSGLSSLTYLDMSTLDLSTGFLDLISAINMLPSLRQLNLIQCGFNSIPLSLSFHLNLTSLTALNLSFNNFNSSFPNWLWNLTSLSSLELRNCGIRGILPNEIGNLISLIDLDLSLNLLSGPPPDAIWKLKHLANLDLSTYFLRNSLSVGIMNLSSLSTLILQNCSLVGPIPSELGNLTTLNAISLDYNSLSGPIPVAIGKLTNLNVLDLSFNLLKGEITKSHLSNLTKLKELFLSDNPFITIPIEDTWIPPFQLQVIILGRCKLGPEFPAWLRSQESITSLLLYNTGIEGNLPEWFWNSFSNLIVLDLSQNNISGTLPTSLESLHELSALNLGSNLLEGPILHLPMNLHFLDLSFNAFSGPLPPTLFSPLLNNLFLSNNHINGSIPFNVCNSHKLLHLNLSHNQISGEIPQCWKENQYLEYINLGNNMLSGELPNSLGNLMRVEFLHLNNNNLKGYLPSSLQNCTQLLVFDVGDNKLYGKIPLWVGQSWKLLRVLRLRSNMFNGNIDPQLGYLRYLQIIDLANNNIAGPMPHSFGNFSSMISTSTMPSSISYWLIASGPEYYWDSVTLVQKGNQLTFSTNLYLVKSIDLSNNSLTNEIPKEVGYLAGLQTLNLSGNYFRGNIPDSIGGMSSLETLDLSFNNFSGAIPQGLSELYSLNDLNLSYNNLSGNIPSGKQLQTLDDASIYIGNPYLCGDLLNKSCFPKNNKTIMPNDEEHAMLPMLSIYLSSIVGYLIGLWSVFVVLLFKEKLRYSYFKKVDEIYDTVKKRFNRLVNNYFS